MVVCEIAWQRLTPAAKALILRIRGEAGMTGTFAGSCAWPDEARRSTHRSTYEYHYINPEPGADSVDLYRDCPAYDCILVALRRYALYVASEPTGDRERIRRGEALAFLGHFVGDLHQPLHVFARDRGGNDFAVTWFGESTNLHRVWDHLILERAGIAGMPAGQRLARAIDPDLAASWMPIDILGWADESLRLARERAYDVPADGRLAESDYQKILPTVTLRLQQAGVRLAALLDALASGKADAKALRIEAGIDSRVER